MIIPYDLVMIAAIGGWLFYRIAEADGRSVLLWPTYSVALVVLCTFVFHWGYTGQLLLQVALFAAMFVVNLFHDPNVTKERSSNSRE